MNKKEAISAGGFYMENKPISLKMLDKKKASTRFGMSLLLITSISIILFFAYMLDHLFIYQGDFIFVSWQDLHLG